MSVIYLPPPTSEERKKRVLVVDDDKLWLSAIERVLRRDFVVTTASSAVTALRAIKEDAPDLVVSDVRMPRMDGLELKDAARDVPFVFLSGARDEQDVHAAKSLGVTEYLEKTGPIEELVFAAKRATSAATSLL